MTIHDVYSISVSWTAPPEWKNSADHVLLIELVRSDSHKNLSCENIKNPYEETDCRHVTVKKEFSKANKNGLIKFQINRRLPKYQSVEGVRVRVINQDYQKSKYSKKVSIEEDNNEGEDYDGSDYELLMRESRPMVLDYYQS